MKKYIIASAAFALVLANQSCNTETKKETTTTMDGMNNKDSMKMDQTNMEGMHSMSGMKMTGDFDYDFASVMVAHHQSSVDMAKDIISKGSNAEVKIMAQNIVTEQEAEIAQFNSILKDYKMPEMKKEAGEAHNELGETMEKMEAKMNGMAKTGNADKDFLMMMIPHHESAVTMGEDELSHGKNLALKKMAQKIMEDQSKEIKQFEVMLAKLK